MKLSNSLIIMNLSTESNKPPIILEKKNKTIAINKQKAKYGLYYNEITNNFELRRKDNGLMERAKKKRRSMCWL